MNLACVRLSFAAAVAVILSYPSFSQSKPSRPAITGISHIIVLNEDIKASKHFYGDVLGWPASKPIENGDGVHYQVGKKQYIEVKSAPRNNPVDRLEYIAFKTINVRALREYLAARGVRVPADVKHHADGAISIMVTDPEGYKIEFVQGGKYPLPSANAVSTHIIHIGFTVRNQAAEAHFYQDILGFRSYWHGWMRDDTHVDGQDDFSAYQVPNGTDWVEFMLAQGREAINGKYARNPHHFAPGVVSVEAAYAVLQNRNLPPNPKSHPVQGRDGKMQLNLFDPDGTRVELMNFQPNEEPCCAPYTAPHPSSGP